MTDGLTAEIETAALDALRERAEAMTPEEAVTWLKELDARLWEKNPRWYAGNSRAIRRRLPNEEALTREDWEAFKVLAKRFPGVPHNAWCHFGFALSLYEFPVAPGGTLDFICTVNTDHMVVAFCKDDSRKILPSIGFNFDVLALVSIALSEIVSPGSETITDFDLESSCKSADSSSWA